MLIDEIAKLKALAEAATPGPWSSTFGKNTCVYFRGEIEGGFDLRDCPRPTETAAFIAAANPTTILALLSHITRVEAERDAAFNDGVEAATRRAYIWWDGEPEDGIELRDMLRALKRPTPQPEKDKS